MPMASQDPLPQAVDFLSLCEQCHKMVGQLWLWDGNYICDECYKEKKPIEMTKYKEVNLQYTEVNIVNKNIYGWSKWYGANNNLFVITPEWYCQACTQQQTKELPSYLIRIQAHEYARICSVCLHLAIENKINNIADLIQMVRSSRPEFC